MKDDRFEEIAAEALASRRIHNLTPHPIRVFASPFCFLGAKPEAGQEGWVNEDVGGSSVLGGYLDIPPSSTGLLRLEEDDVAKDAVEAGRFYDVPETETGLMCACSVRSYGAPEDLPRAKLGVVLIVSLPFAMGLAAAGVNRDDIVCPDTGSTAKRDADGHLVAVTGFVRVLTVEQMEAHRRGVQEGRGQREEDDDARDRNMAAGPPVLSVDSRAEAIYLRKSFERGVRSGWGMVPQQEEEAVS